MPKKREGSELSASCMGRKMEGQVSTLRAQLHYAPRMKAQHWNPHHVKRRYPHPCCLPRVEVPP
ncbi:hypothetical protein M404DRAFT_824405 [Pisolithus tinctorius Marx 270]|uniref:Uncharacterized protein n=1 Tax=Pisolithus tinctorius Marx 270 TaxID=870435 RepID=A0A0C3JN66_PISTI|nr:hypothetical protein M404DRAFT_824405 [Pisolithus tinctorius Marx 270]